MALQEKKKIKDKYSKEFLTDIMLNDFLGKLSKFEIEIARENGLLRWDLWVKAGKLRLPYSYNEGYRTAPVFDGFGGIDPEKTYDTKRYVIKNYAELEDYKVENG